MVRNTIAALLAVYCLAACASNDGKQPSLKEGAREVGHAVGTAAREVGHGAKKVTKEVGHAFRDGGRAVKDAVKGE